MEYNTKGTVLKKPVVWKNLYFYRKSDAIYQLTVNFCKRFLPAHGDRTVDQMVQAARSGKQNIIEGSEDGMTSSEMEIKLLNVARSSLQELREDYVDYINTHQLVLWSADSERQRRLRDFCHSHNDFQDYAPLAERMNDEEFANLLLTLCHQTDKMMCAYVEKLEQRFVTEGGIKERMHAARTGYRKLQDEHMAQLEEENQRLKAEIERLKKRLEAIEGQGEPRKT
ncbi:MAG: four helix bundle suffix domain-containing protein [Bacteroidaceae bacterium]|nr:four helix bundle suffix domain-containing protein [Bacteroidaceae bacterium]